MKNTYYVTTPIYYVNDVPHIGHAYTTIAADVVARFGRLQGKEVFFLTGTDEHGQKIQNAAAASGEEPIELADRVVKRFQNLWEILSITNSDFIRTTEKRHRRAVHKLFQKVYEQGDIYLGKYEGWYNVSEEAFITKTQLDEINKLPPNKRPKIDKIKEESYFFRLSKYQDKLLELYGSNPGFIRPRSRRNEVISFVEGGLKDLSISRTTFSWGIPVPEKEGHVLYVWFDALTNYLTACGYPEDKERFESSWPADLHIVGKDILRFHAVYWPAFLMSAGLKLPKSVFAHGWWTVEGEKMSKSLGNVVDPYKVVDEFGADVFRYFLLREIPFGEDGDYSRASLIGRINGDLANGLGNLVSRTFGMIEKYFDGRVTRKPDLEKSWEKELEKSAHKAVKNAETEMNNAEFNRALVTIWEFIGEVNKYADESHPWTLVKEKDREELAEGILWVMAESIRIINILITPFMPGTSQEIWNKFGFDAGFANSIKYDDARTWGLLDDWSKPGMSIKKGRNIFDRVEISPSI